MDTSTNPKYMFKSPSVDYFFQWHWWAAWIVFVPLSLGSLILSVAWQHTPISKVFLLAVLGLFFWTLFEYSLHRFVFHFIGKSPSLKHMHYVVHGMHHAHPSDPMRVIFPPFGSALFGSIVALVFLLAFPLGWALAIISGFIAGYSWYEFVHYATHHIKWRFAWFKKLKRHHLLHHHSGNYRSSNFGVTSSLWDRVFNTYQH